ncbi:MAG: tRNA uridine-5-carboxymethylaminomethyl(34) synthesis GTPase MnmE [Selenomonadaceae bacterium]|nr:tRNA uridine-5-carboxymethylaminomethyl(34) synthesis GTPase MnmE [Selenomonadaceae bacterium]
MQEETIVAIATARGRAGVGIVRLSGEKAVEIAGKVFAPLGGKSLNEAESHRAVYGNIVINGRRLDDGLAIVMRAPHSYTGEDVAELQCHGAPVLLREIVAACCELGARPAEAGEYTRRAFLNGRLDLLKAQAVMDVIEAKTSASLKLAAGHLSGKASAKVSRWREDILDILVHLEALIDFPEEGIEELSLEEAGEKLSEICLEMERLYRTRNTGKILRDGLVTAIVGTPNAGKSSLLNALLGEERAIVTDIAGTTRDSLEEYADIGGVPLRLIDTAGIRDTEDRVEQLGIQRSRAAMEKAELVLALFDGSRPLSEDDRELLNSLTGVATANPYNSLPSRGGGTKRGGVTASQYNSLPSRGGGTKCGGVTASPYNSLPSRGGGTKCRRGEESEDNQSAYPSVAFGDSSPKGEPNKKVFLLITKSDLRGCDDTEAAIKEAAGDKAQLFNISSKEGAGLEQLTAAIREYALSGVSDEQLTEGGVATEWEAYRLAEAMKSVGAAADAINAGLGADCATIDLTAAVDSLGAILGLTASEDVVDHIFSRFCVGK